MSTQGNRETSGKPLSTADLAAAAHRPNTIVEADVDSVPNRERMPPAADRKNEIMSQSLDATETQPRPSRRTSERAVSTDDEALATERSVNVSAGDTDASGTGPATLPRPAQDAEPRGRVGEVRERDTPPTVQPPPVAFSEALEPLFTPELAETYRSRWGAIQSGFVDDPRRAVRSGDELVAQIMTNLANSFAEERHRVEAQLDDSGDSSTENLRVALRRYRSFFERLLSL
jgi:hypothetical protein